MTYEHRLTLAAAAIAVAWLSACGGGHESGAPEGLWPAAAGPGIAYTDFGSTTIRLLGRGGDRHTLMRG